MAVDYSLAIDKFSACRDELQVRVHGGIYIVPATQEEVKYHGISYINELRQVMEDSTNKHKSYVALKNAEWIITEVQEVRLTAMLVKVELKAFMETTDLPKNPQLSSTYKTLKAIMSKINGYLEICDSQYTYMTEILFGISQVNISINRRFFNGEDFSYNYKDDGTSKG